MSQAHPLRPVNLNNNINPWLLEGVLPRNQVILLDGFAGVGKTALLALLSQKITEQNKKRTILYLSSPKQAASRDVFLQRQKAHFAQLQAVDFQYEEKPLQSRQIYADMLLFIVESLKNNQPHCMIIDGLDDYFADAIPADAKLSRDFWVNLNKAAERFQCTLIITRQQGFHEPRTYGHFTRAGSDHCNFALSMHYHPKAANERVVTIMRHRMGPIGKQFHLKFMGDQAELVEKQKADHVRPVKSPAHDLPVKPVKQPKQQPQADKNENRAQEAKTMPYQPEALAREPHAAPITPTLPTPTDRTIASPVAA
jgi:hypothetical protein